MSDTAITTIQLGLQFMPEGVSPHPLFDRTTQKLDVLVQPAIEDRDLSTPPGSPTDGQSWLVSGTGLAEWSGHDGDIAIFYVSYDPGLKFDWQSPWYFITPYDGMRLWVLDENILITRKNAAWFAGTAITNPTTTLTTMTAALNAIITALEGHGLLDE